MKLESQLQVYTLAGVAPFTVNQATLVTNLNAQYLEGQIGSYYRNAGNLNAGTLLAARLPAFTGDVTSTVGTVGLALAASGATAGTYNNVTVNAKGLVTGGSNASYLTSNQSISITGDATGSGSTGIVLTLANVLATPGTYTKVTANAKGLITAGTSLTSADLPTYTGTITSGQVTTGLGFTPYNASNPSNYITSSGSITGNAATATNGFTFKPGWAGNQNLIAATGNLNSSVPSGFYEAFQATNSPTPTTWCNLINVRHSNTGNDHGFQLAMGYYDETLWSRTYQGGTGANNGTFTTWRAHLHSGNYSSYALPLSGGTLTGGITATNFTGPGTGITGNATSLTAGAVPWSGITSKPTTLSGFGITDAASINGASNQNFSANAIYPYEWIRFMSASGIYWQSGSYAGWHIHPQALWGMSFRSASTDCGLQLRRSNDVLLGSVYSDGTSIGFLDASNGWGASFTIAGAMNRGTVPGSLVTGNISGSAGAVAWSGITSKPTTVSGYGITDTIPLLATIAEASLDAATATGFRLISKTGHSSALFTINVGGSTGPLQIDANYFGLLRWRNQIDSGAANWTAWKTLIHDGNYTSYPDTTKLPLAGGTLTGALNGTTAAFSGAITQNGNQVLHAGNFSSYALPYTGGTLSGGITATNFIGPGTGLTGTATSLSIGGNAATATRTSSQSGYAHAGTGMVAFYNWGGTSQGTNAPDAGSYTTGISVGSHPGDQAYGFQIANNMWASGLWTRNYNSSFGSWVRLLDSSNYTSYPDATKLPLAGGTLTGALNGTTASFSSTVDATQFRDRDDTAYYLDPAGTSNLNKLSTFTMSYNDMNSMHVQSPYAARYGGSVGYRNGTMGYGTTDCNVMFSNWGSGFIDSWSNPANAPGGSTHYVGLQGFHYNHQNSVNAYGFQMLCAGEADNRFFWRSAWATLRSWVEMIHSGNIASQTVATAGSCTGNAVNITAYTINQSVGTGNSPSFYGLSVVSTITGSVTGSSGSCTGNAASASSLAADTSTRFKILTFTGEGGDSGNGALPTSYGIYQQGGSWTHPYPDLCIGFHTGIKIGAYFGYGGTRFFNNSDWATEIFSVGNGDSNVRVVNTIYAAAFSGPLTGNVTGNVTGNLTGLASSATTAGNVNGYSTSTGVGANTIVVRDASGYIYGHYINTNVSESENPSINSFFTSNGDGWLRKSTVAHVKYTLSLSGTNTGDQTNISGSSGSCTGNAASVTDGVYLSTNQSISGVKTFSSAPVATNIAKAWVHYNMNTNTINASYNVSSVTDNGTGVCTVNFSSAMVDANYVVAGTATYGYDNQDIHAMILAVPRYSNAQQAGSCRLATEYIHAAGVYDSIAVRAVFYR